jgi:SAM-dependent methyltransferase
MGEARSAIFENAIRYYEALGPLYYQGTFFDPGTLWADLFKKKYTGGNVPGIDNHGSFVNAIAILLDSKRKISGVDLGCGPHFFVHLARTQLGWDVVGFDRWRDALACARKNFPESADYYRECDFIEKPIPLLDGSQDFAWCNMVIQHFGDKELGLFFKEAARILCNSGVLVLTFKRKTDWQKFTLRTGLKVKVLDEATGLILIEEPKIAKLLKTAPQAVLDGLTKDEKEGMREFRVFAAKAIIALASQFGMEIVPKVPMGGGIWPGIFEFDSGRGLPTATLFFRKKLV